MTSRGRIYWRVSWIGAVILSVLMFTPLVSPSGVIGPEIAGIPRTLWAGILLSIGFVLVTWLASRYFRGHSGETGDQA